MINRQLLNYRIVGDVDIIVPGSPAIGKRGIKRNNCTAHNTEQRDEEFSIEPVHSGNPSGTIHGTILK